MVDAVGNNRGTRNGHGLTMATVSFRASTQFDRLIRTAAMSRGLTKASYIRRALAVAVAADLKRSVVSVLILGPRPTKPGEHSSMRVDLDDGEGISQWCPHPGCNGAHLGGPS